MARIGQLSRAEASPGIQAMYDRIFGEGRDPVAEPGTATGTPGDWWTIWARAPDVLRFFSDYSYANVELAPGLRSLALMRAGYVCECQFVFSQHCKGARVSKVAEEKIEAVPYWVISDVFTPTERAVLAYVDALALQRGRVHDKIFAALVGQIGVKQTLELTYLANLYILHSWTGRSLKMEYDNVPERVVEIPVPDTPGVQNWRPNRSSAS